MKVLIEESVLQRVANVCLTEKVIFEEDLKTSDQTVVLWRKRRLGRENSKV